MTHRNLSRPTERGYWLLLVGVLTSWLLGFGLLFIFAAMSCGLVGLFRGRFLPSAKLLVAALALSIPSAHLAAVSGVYVFHYLHAETPAGDVPHRGE